MYETTTPPGTLAPPAATAPVATPAPTLLRTLGLVAMITSPGLGISLLTQVQGGTFTPGGVGPLFGLAFVFGWFAVVLGMWLLRATGSNIFARIPLAISLVTVPIAAGFNVYEFLDPGSDAPLYSLMDICWPLSMTMMLVTGIIAAVVGKLPGAARFVPLLAGLWFPAGMLFRMTVGEEIGLVLSSAHSTVAWFLLGLVVFMQGRAAAR